MHLSLRFKKFCFASASCACLMAAGAIIDWGLKPNRAIQANAPTAHRNSTTAVVANTVDNPTLKEFAQYWERPLRRALYDPPLPKPEVKQLPPLQLELLGTIIEPPNSMAIVRTEQGLTEYKRVGDTVGPADGPAKIVEIGPSEIVMERTSERVTLGTQTRNVR
jgi:hypothetical protein